MNSPLFSLGDVITIIIVVLAVAGFYYRTKASNRTTAANRTDIHELQADMVEVRAKTIDNGLADAVRETNTRMANMDTNIQENFRRAHSRIDQILQEQSGRG